jgi:hypothetical protein
MGKIRISNYQGLWFSGSAEELFDTWKVQKIKLVTGERAGFVRPHGGDLIRINTKKIRVTWHLGLRANLITPAISVDLHFGSGQPSYALVYFQKSHL